MKQGIVRLIKGEDALPAEHPLHEHDKQSIEVRGDFLPERQCEGSPWCAVVSLDNKEMVGRLDTAIATHEPVILVLENPGGATIYGEVIHIVPTHTMSPMPGDGRAEWVKSYKCIGGGILREQTEEINIEEIDNFLDEAADRRYGKRDQ